MGDQPADHFPWLRYLPGFLYPGHKAGMRLRSLTKNFFGDLIQNMLQKASDGQLNPNDTIAGRWWRDKAELDFDENDVSFLAGVMFVSSKYSFRYVCANLLRSGFREQPAQLMD